jgi:hypothetical protein
MSWINYIGHVLKTEQLLTFAHSHHQTVVDLGVSPLVLKVYIWDHTRSVDDSNMDSRSGITNYHSDFLIGSTFQMRSLIGCVSVT